MFTSGPAFFTVASGGVLPPSPTTETMDYVFQGAPFVVVRPAGVDTSGLDLVLEAKPFFAQ